MTALSHLRARVTHTTGLTRHVAAHLDNGEIVSDSELPVAAWLEIQPIDGAYYLLYLDDSLSQITDGWHLSEAEAKAQAKAEFGIQEDEWFVVPSK